MDGLIRYLEPLEGQIATMLDRPQRRIRFVEPSVQDHGDRIAALAALGATNRFLGNG